MNGKSSGAMQFSTAAYPMPPWNPYSIDNTMEAIFRSGYRRKRVDKLETTNNHVAMVGNKDYLSDFSFRFNIQVVNETNRMSSI